MAVSLIPCAMRIRDYEDMMHVACLRRSLIKRGYPGLAFS